MIRALLDLLPARSGRHVAVHLTLTVLGVILRAAGAVLLVPLVGALFSGDPASAWPWLGALAAATVAGWVIDAAAARQGFRLGFEILDSGQRTVADRITDIRLSWFTAEHTATARQAVAATGPDLVGIIIYFVAPLVSAILLPTMISIALLALAWQLGVAALAGIVVLLVAFWASGRLGRNADRAAATANNRLTERVLEFARTQQALRAARRVAPARSHAGAALTVLHGATMRTLLLQVPGQLLFGLANQLALLALVATTVTLTVDGSLTVPEAIALVVVIVRYLETFTVLAELSPGIETVTGTLRRIRKVLQAPRDPNGDTRPRIDRAPRIELRDVGFGYDTGPRVFDGLDLTFEPGTTTAIIGPSGSGKSTVLALIAGLQHPDNGAVLIDGHNLATVDSATRRGLVSMVFQTPYLFDGSIHDNIRVGDPDATDVAVDTAAHLARVDTVIDRLGPRQVGESGASISGGERQRVSIARALLKPAPVLLVDEATSALDTENEAAVTTALTDDPTSRTRIIVAHRLSSIRAADRIIFLDDGRVVEDGALPDLIAAEGRFAEFWRQQDAAAGWRLGT
ncbi:ABC transporter ATP-binding protein [Actinomyces sp. Marseille-P3109]|uniref:ABC transporter ATP-binding protein n=1 Tax=Actinomyces sp. Marseille-P3109 TaxID=2083009 RepID=UPI000D54DBE9|nr:ABC transporter ATP-binding protein [Actinomyces sp. Marseille-P3109]